MIRKTAVISGHVDEMAGAYVTGWAIALPYRRACEIEIINEKGVVVATGSASLPRPDLLALGHERTDFAFRIPIGDLDNHQLLTVRADGRELPGSPLTIGAGIFDGHMSVSQGYVTGWVSERKDRFAPPVVRIFDQDDRLLGLAYSKFSPKAQDGSLEPAQFSLEIPDWCYRKPANAFRAVVQDQLLAQTRCTLSLLGAIDSFRADRIVGWLLSPDAPHKRFLLQVWRDGELVGEGRCGLPRADLRERHPHSWSVGFDIALTRAEAADMQACVMSLRLADSSEEALGGPFIAGSRAAMIAAGRQLAQAVHSPMVQLTDTERSVLRVALADCMHRIRGGEEYVVLPQTERHPAIERRRLTILIPVYRNVELTHACIESVLLGRNPETDAVVLINDCSPDEEMQAMLHGFAHQPRVTVVTNEVNQGFIKSINRGLAMCQNDDVLILNSDTRLFDGALDELWRIAHAAPEIGTVTALSNNATIFSYPHPSDPGTVLEDVSWSELARIALQQNAGMHVDVPTGHGFCMLMKREVLDLLPRFNEAFGRGYGEENEFCLRAADLGYRHVAAAGVLVEHRESVSFGELRHELVRGNLEKLAAMYPEYLPTVMDFEHHDRLRQARWMLDAFRLRRAAEGGARFAVVVETWLGHGTQKAVADIEAAVGYGGARKLRLSCDQDGKMFLQAASPRIRAVFAPEESAELFDMLGGLPVDLVVVHHLIGFSREFIERFERYIVGRNSIYHAHDFFAICPRVTMIDASGQYCARADTDRCLRCVGIAGSHAASRIDALSPAEHRDLFHRFLKQIRHIVAPSRDTATHLTAVFPDLKVHVIPHPQSDAGFFGTGREGDFARVVVLGAIGPHKGSGQLLELAKLALLTHPHLHFVVVGYTDIDDRLDALRNVTILGAYSASDLPQRLAEARGRIALFLHGWPETFLYTLTEAVAAGLVPLVPDIGAPAERVRDAGFGAIFPFPISSREILAAIDGLAAAHADRIEGAAARFATPRSPAAMAELMGVFSPA